MPDHYAVATIFDFCARHWPASHNQQHLYALSLHRLAALEAARSDEVVRRLGLTLTEFDLLATLRRSAPPHILNPSVLQRATLLSSGGLTKVLHQLAERGLVERSLATDDKRGRLVHLTEAGKALAEQTMTAVLRLKTDSLAAAGLTAEELTALNGLLGRVLTALENPPRP